jgi:hypothetical protein
VTNSSDSRTASPLAIPAVVAVALWVLVGACFKLFWGTPADLPQPVRDFPLELGLTYNLAISIEIAIALVALLRPRWGWLPQALLLVVFDVVLAQLMVAGAENCGCFGSSVSMPPWAMMTIDSVLLLALLVTRPWRLPPGRVPVLLPVAAVALAAVLPWLLDRQVKDGEVVADGQPVEGAWKELQIESWIGRDVWDTPLAQPPLDQSIDVMALPLDGLWVFWRQTCDHCAEHLSHLAEVEHGQRLIALIQLEEPGDTEANRVVYEMPTGNFVLHARLPPTMTYILQTPGEMLLEGGRIVKAQEGATTENGF